MNRRFFSILLGLVAVSAFAAGCGKAVQNDNANNDTMTVTNDVYDINAVLANIVTNDVVNEDANTNTTLNTNSTNTNSSFSNTNSTTNTNSSTNSNTNTSSTSTITVTLPAVDAKLTSPFMVEGTATGTQVFARVRSANGTAIFTEKISVSGGKFKGKLLFDFTSTRAGFLDVFQKNDAGQETDLITVPVTFAAASTASSANTNSVSE